MLSKDDKMTDPTKSDHKKPKKTETKTNDKIKVKASTDKKLDSLMHSMSEIQGNLSQLASDFYETDPGPSQGPPRGFRCSMNFENDPNYHGYDNYSGNWRHNFNNYDDDDWYAGSAYSHDYSYDKYGDYDEDDWDEEEEETMDDDKYQESFTTSTPNPRKWPRMGDHDEEESAERGAAPSHDKEMDNIAAEYETTKPHVLQDATTDPMPQQLATTRKLGCGKGTTQMKSKQYKRKHVIATTPMPWSL